MAILEDKKRDEETEDSDESPVPGDLQESRALIAEPTRAVTVADESEKSALDPDSNAEEEEEDGTETPAQLGAQRFVYAAYFTGAVAIAFLLSKAISFGWMRLSLWKPQVGEPDEMVAVVAAAVVGALVAFYYYRDEKVRTLAEEVASELGKVTWPTRDEVVNGTFVVLVTTLLATAFFALMDRFWGFVTNLVYGA